MLDRRIAALEKRSKTPLVHLVVVGQGETIDDAIKRSGAVAPFVFVPAKDGDNHGQP